MAARHRVVEMVRAIRSEMKRSGSLTENLRRADWRVRVFVVTCALIGAVGGVALGIEATP